jgi:hypothetical protein
LAISATNGDMLPASFFTGTTTETAGESRPFSYDIAEASNAHPCRVQLDEKRLRIKFLR